MRRLRGDEATTTWPPSARLRHLPRAAPALRRLGDEPPAHPVRHRARARRVPLHPAARSSRARRSSRSSSPSAGLASARATTGSGTSRRSSARSSSSAARQRHPERLEPGDRQREPPPDRRRADPAHLGALRRRGDRAARRATDSRTLEVLPVVPFFVLAGQSYGGEGLLRVALLSGRSPRSSRPRRSCRAAPARSARSCVGPGSDGTAA